MAGVNTSPGFSPGASMLASLNKGQNNESENQGSFRSISRKCILIPKSEV